MDYANYISGSVAILSFLGGIIFYHIKQSSRISVLENDLVNLEEHLKGIEIRLSQELRDLGQKLDRFIYSIAGMTARRLGSDDANE